ncbi:MAG: TM1812 family CRISPR-associated protein [Limnochordia bacterium]|jgi:CRISPR-associated DxTHG motif protein
MKLVTFLGIGRYQSALYYWGDEHFTTPFVQRALVELMPDISETILFATDRAWELNGSSILEAMPKGFHRERLQNEDDFMAIFACLNAMIGSGERLVIDITHSYRSIPMVALPLINYLKLAKDVQIDGVYYGRVEHDTGPPLQGKIVDLSDIIYFERWTLAVSAFLRYGKGDQLAGIIDEEVTRRYMTPAEAPPRKMGELRSALQQLSGALDANRLAVVARESQRLYNLLTSDGWQEEASGPLHMILPLIDRLTGDVALFRDAAFSPAAKLQLARWYLEHHDLISAALVARETVITQYLQKNDRAEYIMNREQREEMVRRMRQELPEEHPLALLDSQLSDIRNSLAHCGLRGHKEGGGTRFRDKDMDPQKIPHRLLQLIDELERALDDDTLWKLEQTQLMPETS